jgi:hypothetical protein
MKRFASVLILFSIVVSGCYDNHSEPTPGEFSKQANCTIAQLRELCNDGLCYLVKEERICVGRVTSSDREGNFYRSVVIEDNSGGVEVKLGTYNLASQYPVGLMVALHLDGTALMIENGVVQMGLPPQSFDSAPREMEAQEVIDRHLLRSNSIAPTTPSVSTVEELSASRCGQFVEVENIIHAPLTESNEEEYYRFVDESNNAIFIYISRYADFSDTEIPISLHSVQGILYHESVGLGIGKQFVIKPRFKDDFSATNAF